MIIKWLPQSLANRDKLIRNIAEHNVVAAVEHLDEIHRQVDDLAAHPEMGREGRRQGTRELVISQTEFVVVYRIRPKLKRVELMRVLHARQQYP